MEEFLIGVAASVVGAAIYQRWRESGSLFRGAPLLVHIWVRPVLSRRAWKLAPLLTAGLLVDAPHRDKPPVRRDFKMAMWDESPSWDDEDAQTNRRTELLQQPLYPLSTRVSGGNSVCVIRVVLHNRSNSPLVPDEVGPIHVVVPQHELTVLGWRYGRFDEPGLKRRLRDPLPDDLGRPKLHAPGQQCDYSRPHVPREGFTTVTFRLREGLSPDEKIRDDLTLVVVDDDWPDVDLRVDSKSVPVTVRPYEPVASRGELLRHPLRSFRRRLASRRARALGQ